VVRRPAHARRVHAAEAPLAERPAGDLGADDAPGQRQRLLELADQVAVLVVVGRHLCVEEVALEEIQLAAQVHARVRLGHQRLVVDEDA
jgi:hypothetical protein